MTDHAFWDRIAPRYAQSPISDPDAYEATLARVKTYLSRDHNAVELGCGTGSTALTLAPFVAEYEGTDVSQGMIDIALEKAWNASMPNLSFRRADAEETFKMNGDPDVILAFNLLHLIPQLEYTLEAILDALPVGGLFISKTPCVGEKWYFRPLIAAMRMVGKAPYVRLLKVRELDHMIVAAGFEIVETGLFPASTGSRFIVARKR